jgi:preprotein translocase subunit SecG
VGLNQRIYAFIFVMGIFFMGLFHFLIVVQGIIAATLVGVILMQRSEGGGLGGGGSPGGLVSARGASDFLTRTTAILATLFIVLSITLAFVAARQGSSGQIDADALKPAATAPAKSLDGAGNVDPTKAGATPAKPETTDSVPLDK